MQRETNYATVFSVLAFLAILVFGFLSIANVNSGFRTLGEKVSDIEFDVDEQAIADAIVADIEIPEVDNDKVVELWNAINGVQLVTSNFEDTVEDFSLDEFDDGDAVAWLESILADFDELVGDFVLDEITVTNSTVGDYELDEYTFNDDHDDRFADVEITFDFEYTEVGEPSNHIYDGSITLTHTYVQNYDTVDEEYEDEEVSVPAYN